MKKRISLSIEEGLIKKIPRGENRSAFMENILRSYVDSRMQCVVLAGGNPKYLWVKELGEYRPFVKINGKSIIEILMRKVMKFSCSDFVVIGSSEIISRCFRLFGGGESLGCRINYVEEKNYGHTGNTIKLADKIVKSTFLFMPCDHYFDFSLNELTKTHKSGKYAVTLAVYGGYRYDSNRNTIVELNGDKITNYWDEPKVDETMLTSTMIGLAEPSIFGMIPDSTCSLHNNVFPSIMSQGRLGGVILSGKFVNIHTLKDIETVKSLEGKR